MNQNNTQTYTETNIQANTKADASTEKVAGKTSAGQLDSTQKDDELNHAIAEEQPKEFGGPKGLEPTRYGDWEKKGRCIDF